MTADMMTKGTQIRNLPLHSQQEDAMLHYQAKPWYWEKRIPDSVAMTTNSTQISCWESGTTNAQSYKMNESATSRDAHVLLIQTLLSYPA